MRRLIHWNLAVLLTALLVGGIHQTEAAGAAAGALDNAGHLYTLDGWGGVHPAGTSPALARSAYWRGWDIARGMTVFPDGAGGFVLDGWGGLHPLGSTSAVSGTGYWPGWDIARQVVTAPWATTSAPSGWVLDGWGGIHPFGGAPAVASGGYWPGWDIARGLVVLPDSTRTSVRGYVLDGWGGVHPFGGAPAVPSTAYWPGWDIARGISLLPQATAANPGGYVLDGWGGLHPFGSAPPVKSGGYWPGWDIAHSITAWTAAPAGQPGGWVMDGWGGLHEFGSAPALRPGDYWPGWDIARSTGGAGSSTGSRSFPPSTPPLPRFDHIFVIVMENKSYADVVGNPSAPYINSLAAQYSLATNYSGVAHPSLPNYLAMVGGSTFGVGSDCTSCFVSAGSLADRVEGSGRSWKAYQEDQPGACFVGDAYPYAQKHDPLIYFDNIRQNPARCSRIVPFTQLAADLGTAASTPNLGFITPNLCNDMHDCDVATGDDWLRRQVPAILGSPAFVNQNSLLAIVWDEDDWSGSNQVPLVLAGPAVRNGYRSSARYDHYALLKTIEASWGLQPLTASDSAAPTMTDFFLPPSI